MAPQAVLLVLVKYVLLLFVFWQNIPISFDSIAKIKCLLHVVTIDNSG